MCIQVCTCMHACVYMSVRVHNYAPAKFFADWPATGEPIHHMPGYEYMHIRGMREYITLRWAKIRIQEGIYCLLFTVLHGTTVQYALYTVCIVHYE